MVEEVAGPVLAAREAREREARRAAIAEMHRTAIAEMQRAKQNASGRATELVLVLLDAAA